MTTEITHNTINLRDKTNVCCDFAGGLMSIDDIRAAWEVYHGPDWSMGYLPDVPPTYSRGYRDGRASVAAEVAEVIGCLAETWGDDDQSRATRDRLRALL